MSKKTELAMARAVEKAFDGRPIFEKRLLMQNTHTDRLGVVVSALKRSPDGKVLVVWQNRQMGLISPLSLRMVAKTSVAFCPASCPYPTLRIESGGPVVYFWPKRHWWILAAPDNG